MTELRIDREKAERMIAQILRDEQKMQPAQANALAENICRRLFSAMPTPTNQPLMGMRMIGKHRPFDPDFDDRIFKLFPDAGQRAPEILWGMVYDRATDLPPGVADTIKW